MRVVFLGTDDVSLHVFRALRSVSSVRSVSVATLAGSLMQRVCASEGIDVELVPSRGSLAAWRPAPADLALIASFGRILPRTFAEHFGDGVINMHPSLLPKYRGAAPIHHAILNGDTITAASVLEFDPARVDGGPVLAHMETYIGRVETYDSVRSRLAALGGSMAAYTLRNLAELRSRAVPQDHAKATPAPKVSPDYALLFHERTQQCAQVLRTVRVFGHVSAALGSKRCRVEIDVARALDALDRTDARCAPGRHPYGTLWFSDAGSRASPDLWLSLADGAVPVTSVHRDGAARPIGPREFLNMQRGARSCALEPWALAA